MPGRFVITVLAGFSFPLVCASSGTASEISFDGEVLGYQRPREHYGMVVGLRGSAEPPYLRIQLGRERDRFSSICPRGRWLPLGDHTSPLG